MDTVTYSDSRTVEFVQKNLIALRVNVGAPRPDWARSFTIQYTPTIITLDGERREHQRVVGFLPPEEFIPSQLLGIGRGHLHNNLPAKALLALDKLLVEYPNSKWSSQAKELRKVGIKQRY